MVGWFQGRGEKVLCSTNGIECITRINSQLVLSNKIEFPCSMCVTLRQVYASPIGVFYQTWTRLFQISSWRISTSFDEAQVKPDATRREPTHFYVRRLTRRDSYLVSLTVRHSIRNILTQDECNIWLWLEVNPWASWHRWGQVARTRLRNAYARIVFYFNCVVFIFGQTIQGIQCNY